MTPFRKLWAVRLLDGTGLFDFNKGIKVDPSTIFNFSAGYSLVVAASVLRPELYIENVFNTKLSFFFSVDVVLNMTFPCATAGRCRISLI